MQTVTQKQKMIEVLDLLKSKSYSDVRVSPEGNILVVAGNQLFEISVIEGTPTPLDADGLIYTYYVGPLEELDTISALLRVVEPQWGWSAESLGVRPQDHDLAVQELKLEFHGWLKDKDRPYAVLSFDDNNGVRRRHVICEVKFAFFTPYVNLPWGSNSQNGVQFYPFWLI